MSKRHGIKVRWRAFRIWQELGFLPWQKAPASAPAPAPAATPAPASALASAPAAPAAPACDMPSFMALACFWSALSWC